MVILNVNAGDLMWCSEHSRYCRVESGFTMCTTGGRVILGDIEIDWLSVSLADGIINGNEIPFV